MGEARQILESYLQNPGFLVLDGGLATELEARGHDLNHPLWSAHLLAKDPDAIRSVHLSYLQAGADCLITSSYQASSPGFAREGYTRDEAERLLQRSVELGLQARQQFLEEGGPCLRGPLVAASIGPYGAMLADGSEYHGNYGVSRAQLRDFHEPRWRLLARSQADLLACETIPSLTEAEVLRELMGMTPEVPVWVSFTCRDGTSIRDGTPLADVLQLFRDCLSVVALGINCTAPQWVPELIRKIREISLEKPIVVYPNSGELYDARQKKWSGSEATENPEPWRNAVRQWYQAGARLIGGCCRIGPRRIEAIRPALLELAGSSA